MSDRRNECSITNYASTSLSLSLFSFATMRCARAKKHYSSLRLWSLLLFAEDDRRCFLFRVKGSACHSEAWLNNYCRSCDSALITVGVIFCRKIDFLRTFFTDSQRTFFQHRGHRDRKDGCESCDIWN